MITRMTIIVAVLAMFAVAAAAHAQRKDGPVAVAITDTLPRRDARAMIIRHAKAVGRDVIILKRSEATPALLAGALVELEARRDRGPSDKEQDITMLQGVSLPVMPKALGNVVTATLERLAGQPMSRIGNLGEGQWVQLSSTRRAP